MQVYETSDNLTKAQVKEFLTWFDKEIGTDYEVNENGWDENRFYIVFFDLEIPEVFKIREYENNYANSTSDANISKLKNEGYNYFITFGSDTKLKEITDIQNTLHTLVAVQADSMNEAREKIMEKVGRSFSTSYEIEHLSLFKDINPDVVKLDEIEFKAKDSANDTYEDDNTLLE